MNLARAFAAMALLAAISVAIALAAFVAGLRLADAEAVGSAHGVLAVAARRIESAYEAQIVTLRSDLAVPLAAEAIDGFGRRVVGATIGDNEGIDGGLYLYDGGIVADGPQRVASGAQRAAIVELARAARMHGGPQAATLITPQGDVVAIDAVALADGRGAAFARQRIAASVLRGARSTLPLVAAAVAASIGVIGFAAWIIWTIRRDAQHVIAAIALLESDPAARPALPSGDFGRIALAVTTMAGRRAAAEAAAQRSERLAAIGRLAANTAHEIRNPLNALRLQIALMKRRLGPSVDDAAAKLGAEIERLDAVVSRMLETRSDAPLATARVDLRDVTQRAIDTLEIDALARDRRIAFACEADDTYVDGDAGRLVQLAINILANAVDAAPPRSAVDVRISTGPVLRVADRGAGISAGDIERLFEPFFTTKPSGTGLGLAIAHEIARAHGARIDVRSAPGRTEFAVDFRPHSDG